MADPNNAGPYEVGLNGSLAAGASTEILLSEVRAGAGDKKGFLRKVFGKRGGMDFIFIVNASGELISVEAKSGKTFIPPATSQNLTNGPYRQFTVINEGANSVNNNDDDRVAVEVGNNERRSAPEDKPTFSARDALNDTVPGLNL